jgi:ABC-type transport system substrate-binding protein
LTSIDSDAIDLARFEQFYDGAPLLSSVRILYGTAAAQPLNLYEAGRVDVTDVPFYALDRVLSDADPLNRELVVQPQFSTSYIAMSPRQEPFDDPAIRRAVALAFDRAMVANVSLDGKVSLAEGLVPPGILGRDWRGTTIPFDPDEAISVLSGVEPPDVAPTFFGGGATISLKLVVERELGIDVDAVDLEWSDFSARLADQSLPAYQLTWIADFPDPANFLAALFHSRSPDNYLGYQNADVDRLLDAADVEPEPQRRAALYLEAQQRILDDAVLIPLYHDVSYTVVKPYVRGLTISQIGILSLEDVWIDE